jgi:hypothetical protein
MALETDLLKASYFRRVLVWLQLVGVMTVLYKCSYTVKLVSSVLYNIF